MDFSLTDNFSGLTHYFSDCIQNRQKPEPDGEEGRADIMIMRAIEESARSGVAQKLSIPAKRNYAQPEQMRSFPAVERRLVL